MSTMDASSGQQALDQSRWREWLLASLQETGVRRPPRARIAGVIWPILLLVVVTIPWVIIFKLVDNSFRGPDLVLRPYFYVIWIVLGGLVIGPIRVAIVRRVRRVRARSAEEALERSTQRPILYLRSFNMDKLVGRVSWLQRALTASVNAYFPPTAEERLTLFFRKLGPVIAIGRPDEELPALGAARFYVSHALWQQKVADVVHVSQFIVWVSGTTEGLRWELSHLLKSVAPGQLVLWAHPHLMSLKRQAREAEWRLFLEKLGGLFPKALPEELGEARFFHFGPEFEPIPVRANKYALGTRQADAMRSLLAAKGLRRKPSWFWRSDNPFVRYGLGFLVSVLVSVASQWIQFQTVNARFGQSFWATVGVVNPLLAGLWGMAFIWLQPVLARAPVAYLVGAALFGLVRLFVTALIIIPFIIAPIFGSGAPLWALRDRGLPWFEIFAVMFPPLTLVLAIIWGLAMAVLLRWCPYGPGRPPKPMSARTADPRFPSALI